MNRKSVIRGWGCEDERSNDMNIRNLSEDLEEPKRVPRLTVNEARTVAMIRDSASQDEMSLIKIIDRLTNTQYTVVRES